jgi:hypothetical protein
MEVNEYQIGGNHYNNKPYQHWDWAIDTNQPYLIACATKYVSRWREKNGVQDLRKAAHYLAKAEERGIKVPTMPRDLVMINCSKYLAQLNSDDALIIIEIMSNDFTYAQRKISELVMLTEADCGPTSAYVNQD